MDVVLVVGGGGGGGGLPALDDLDGVGLLVAPPAHHARPNFQRQMRRPGRGRGRGSQPPLDPSVRRGGPAVARRGGRGGAVLRRGGQLHRAHLVVGEDRE